MMNSLRALLVTLLFVPDFALSEDDADLSKSEIIAAELSKPLGDMDTRKVVALLEVAVEEGELGAHSLLGVLYRSDPVVRNTPKAFYHFSASARTGAPNSQYYLGQMYTGALESESYLVDFNKSYMWLSIAKGNGFKGDPLLLSALSERLGLVAEIAVQEAARRCVNSKYKFCD